MPLYNKKKHMHKSNNNVPICLYVADTEIQLEAHSYNKDSRHCYVLRVSNLINKNYANQILHSMINTTKSKTL